MIRSSIPVLVDSALRDLDPQQLVLFIQVSSPLIGQLCVATRLLIGQSFGIPVESMTKLLQTLDTAVTADLEAVSHDQDQDCQDSDHLHCQVSESVLDKAYMGQLVAVQHNRGAEGGRVFARALDLDLNLASNQVRIL